MASRWRVLFHLRAVEVAVRCVRARGVLADAAERLASPMHVADAQVGRERLELLGAVLTDAKSSLALAGATLAAAEHLALRGAAGGEVAGDGELERCEALVGIGVEECHEDLASSAPGGAVTGDGCGLQVTPGVAR